MIVPIPPPAVFHAPKAGSTEQEYEDASGYRLSEDGRFIRLAIADGATESFRSGQWARYLVDAFVSADFEAWWGEVWITEARAGFERQNDYANLPWHAVIKAANGSHAAFMGLEVDLIDRTFRTFGVGDSCLLVQGKKTQIYPRRLSESPDFNFTPALVSTRSPELPYPRKTKKRSFGNGTTQFWLMTDALAEALLIGSDHQLEAAADALRNVDDETSFNELVDGMRTSKTIKNDDVTLVHLIVGERMD